MVLSIENFFARPMKRRIGARGGTNEPPVLSRNSVPIALNRQDGGGCTGSLGEISGFFILGGCGSFCLGRNRFRSPRCPVGSIQPLRRTISPSPVSSEGKKIVDPGAFCDVTEPIA